MSGFSINALNIGLGGLAKYQLEQNEKNKQDTKDLEQRTYDRNRQGIADQQSAGLYEDQRQNNKQSFAVNNMKIEGLNRENIEAKRQQYLTDQLVEAQRLAGVGDDDGLFSSYGELINNQTLGDPKTGMYSYKVEKQADGTGNINAYDRNTGALVNTTAKGITKDHILKTIYSQIKPIESIENDYKTLAEVAKEKRALKVDDYKWDRDYKGDLKKLSIQSQDKWNMEEYTQGRADQRARLTQEGANYRHSNPQTTGKAPTLTPVFNTGGGGGIEPTTANIAQFTGHQESKGQHITNGKLTPTYDPKSSAKGWGQFTDGTRNLALKGSGYDAYGSKEDAIKATEWLQEYNERLLGGDKKAAAIAHYAGAGEVRNWMTQAQKQGVSWQAIIPEKYRARAQAYDQQFGGGGQQNTTSVDQSKQTTANAIGSNVAPTAKWVSEAFEKDTESGITPAKIMGTLQQTSTLLTKATNSKNPNERQKYYDEAAKAVNLMIAGSNLSAQEKEGMRRAIFKDMYGMGSINQVVDGMGFMSLSQVKQAQGANQPDSTRRGNQRANAASAGNPFIDPDAELFKQAPDVDRSLINNALRGG